MVVSLVLGLVLTGMTNLFVCWLAEWFVLSHAQIARPICCLKKIISQILYQSRGVHLS